jgi:hypothetical protein
MEIAVGGTVGLITFGLYTMADRYIATRDGAKIKSPSAPIYKDWGRLALGVGGTVIPLTLAHFIRGPVVRSSLQFAGIAVLFGFGGKLLEDVGALLLKDNETGKRLFAGEIFAQDALAQTEKTGTAGAPTGAGKPDEKYVPPPPAVFNGQPSPAALAAVKQHAPALRALGGIAPHIEAMQRGAATPEQIKQVEEVRTLHAGALAELGKFNHEELKAAAGLAGLSATSQIAPRESVLAPPKPAPATARSSGAPQFNWANSGEKKDAA